MDLRRVVPFVPFLLALAFTLSLGTACTAPPPPEPIDACGGKCTDEQICVDSECLDKICEPFAQSCADAATLLTCNGNGTAQLSETCPGGTACLAGSCASTVCIPETYFCGSDGERKLCSSDGLSFATDACPSGQGCSGAGQCVDQICSPSEVLSCVTEGSRDIMRCDLSGTAQVSGQCDSDQRCVANQCKDLICSLGRKFCVDNQTLADCADFGTAAENIETCDVGTGAQCMVDADNPDGALCATACDVAANSKSYIACDYRFAITDNSLADDLRSGTDAFPAAVVIANANDQPVLLTLYGHDGNVLSLPAKRSVGDRNPTGTLPNQDVHSKITVAGNTTNIDSQAVDGLSLAAGGTATLLLPDDAVHGSGIFAQGYHLEASLPVSAYIFNPICCNYAYSNDASLLIPTTAWRQAYYVVSAPHRTWSAGFLGMQQNEDASSPATITVVASQDNTQVVIKPRAGQPVSEFKIENGLPNFGNDSAHPGELRLNLNANEVLQLETAYASNSPDPTGVLVASDKAVAVFGGNECAYVPEKKQACDHLEEMMLPIETWGTTYLGVMPRLRNPDTSSAENQERLYYRFVSASGPNRVQILPKPVDFVGAHAANSPTCNLASDGSFVLAEGDFCEFGSRDNFQITSAEPVMVGVLFVGQDATGLTDFGSHAGDPSLSQLVPVDQYRKSYSFLTPDSYAADYVTVNYKDNSSILLDEAAITGLPACSGDMVNCIDQASVAIAGTAFSAVTLRLSRGAHTMRSVSVANATADGDRFGIFNYGYDDYVSYAYPGGLDLVQTSTFPNMPDFN